MNWLPPRFFLTFFLVGLSCACTHSSGVQADMAHFRGTEPQSAPFWQRIDTCREIVFDRPEKEVRFRSEQFFSMSAMSNRCGIEQELVFYKSEAGTKVIWTRARGEPLAEQFRAIEQRQPSASIQEICQGINVEVLSFDENGLPGLREFGDELLALEVPALLTTPFGVHNTWYKVVITRVANESAYKFSVPVLTSSQEDYGIQLLNFMDRLYLYLGLQCPVGS